MHRPSFLVRPAQRVHTELTVGPDLQGRPAAALRERGKGFDRVFVAVFGMDGLAGTERYRRALDAHLLPAHAGKVHFDTVLLGVVERVVLEGRQVEVRAELAIDT